MRLDNTDYDEDKTLTSCECFGGLAEECAKICERLDEAYTAVINERDILLVRVDDLEKEIEELKSN